jgi:hypothetical protein
MRKPTDLCLLCKREAAHKANSHIFPKFLSKRFLGKKRKGFQVSSDVPFGSPPKIVQDSPKDDYIFCSSCEEFLGVIEAIACDTFTNWRYKCEKGDFDKHTIQNDVLSIIECNTSNKLTVRLFIYSLFWRSSISEDSVFNNINLSDYIEENFRQILLKYKSISKKDFLLKLCHNTDFELFPLTIITAESFKDETSNILYLPEQAQNGVHKLIVDQFVFLLFESNDNILIRFFKIYSNIKAEDCKIILFSQEYWQQNIIDPSIESIAKLHVENAKRLK